MRTYKEQGKYRMVNEALENDITWGDSWAGRIFSSIFRNAKLALDLKIAIPSLLNQLDAAINAKVLEEISKDENISDAINDVKNAGITDAIIEGVKKKPNTIESILKSLAEENGEDKLENIINALPQELQDILAALIDYGNDDNKDIPSTKEASIYPTMVSNLKALLEITKDDLTFEIIGGKRNPRPSNGNHNAAPDSSPKEHVVKGGSWKEVTKNDTQPIGESLTVLKFSDYHTISEKVEIGNEDSQLKNAYHSISGAIQKLTDTNNKGIAVDAKLLSGYISKANNTDSKISIKKLYAEIYNYVAVYKGHQELSSLETPSTLHTIAEKIAAFYSISNKLEDGNFYGAMGDLGKSLKRFNLTMSKIIEFHKSSEKVTENVDLPTEIIKESFLSNLFSKDNSENKIRVSGFGNKVTIMYNGIEHNTQEEMDKLAKANLQSITDKVKEINIDEEELSTVIEKSVIDVIEIVRIFNKANRLIVKNNIPSSRTNGRINVNRSNKWTKIDGGGVDPANPGTGPFRNDVLFQAWNDGVLLIIKNNSEILKGAKLVDDNGKLIKSKYPITKFMTDSLDNSKMFFKGNQSKYLHTYFGISDTLNDKDESRRTSKYPITEAPIEKEKIKSEKVGGNFTFDTVLGEFKEDLIYKLKISGNVEGKSVDNYFYFVGLGVFDGHMLYKMSQSDEIIKKYAEGYEPSRKVSKISHIFFKDGSKTKSQTMKVEKRIMPSNVLRIDESKVLEFMITKISSVSVLRENGKEITAVDNGIDIKDNETYNHDACMMLKRTLIDNAPIDEKIKTFSDYNKK